MGGCCDVDAKNARDVTILPAAWLLWYAAIAFDHRGIFWTPGRNWLWAAAFAVMGIGCVVNASRCQRLHCYFTGPLFLAAAGYAIASQFRLIPLHASLFLLVVVGLACAFQFAERPFGRYRGSA